MKSDKLDRLYQDPNVIRTYTGRYIDPLNTTPDDFHLRDIAWGLAHTYRFRCATAYSRPLTVAEHSCRVADGVWGDTQDPEAALYALFHDAAEAYLGDMPTPIKHRLPDYQAAENRMMSVIYRWLKEQASIRGLTEQDALAIKRVDQRELEREWTKIISEQGSWVPPLTSEASFDLFRLRYSRYFNRVQRKSKDI